MDSRATDEPDVTSFPEGGYGCECPSCTTLASGLNGPVSLVIVGSVVYFLSYGPEDGQGSLMRVATSGGGTPETVVANLTRPFSIVADANDLYWQAEDGKGAGIIEKLPLAGGTPQTLAGGLSTLQSVVIMSTLQAPLTNDVAVTPTDVYFVGFSGGMQAGILRVPIDGGAVSTVISQWPGDGGAAKPLSVNGFVTDGSSLFAVTNGIAIGVIRVPLSGAGASVLVQDLANPWALALDGTDIFFFDVGLNFKNGTLQSVPQAGGSAKTLLTRLASPWAMVPAGGSVYFVEDSGPVLGSVRVFDVGTGRATPLAEGLMSPVAVAVDSKSVYWADISCGSVMKVPR